MCQCIVYDVYNRGRVQVGVLVHLISKARQSTTFSEMRVGEINILDKISGIKENGWKSQEAMNRMLPE